jgi:hypothetical protein
LNNVNNYVYSYRSRASLVHVLVVKLLLINANANVCYNYHNTRFLMNNSASDSYLLYAEANNIKATTLEPEDSIESTNSAAPLATDFAGFTGLRVFL